MKKVIKELILMHPYSYFYKYSLYFMKIFLQNEKFFLKNYLKILMNLKLEIFV